VGGLGFRRHFKFSLITSSFLLQSSIIIFYAPRLSFQRKKKKEKQEIPCSAPLRGKKGTIARSIFAHVVAEVVGRRAGPVIRGEREEKIITEKRKKKAPSGCRDYVSWQGGRGAGLRESTLDHNSIFHSNSPLFTNGREGAEGGDSVAASTPSRERGRGDLAFLE